VEEGQTVAASLNTPTLFTIAEDLSSMNILASVDESDIGQIEVDQFVEFTVQSYPDEVFNGTVQQIRLQPQTLENVVNYTVVVNADNNEGLLLPGMTATVDFYVEQKVDVLLVPSSALRFNPPDELMQEYFESMRDKFDEMPDSIKNQIREMRKFGGENNGGRQSDVSQDNFKSVWLMDENGELIMTRVLAGSTDGKMTEIVKSKSLKQGDEVISGYNSPEKEETKKQTTTRMPRRM
jgi:HlyD family secretion protein